MLPVIARQEFGSTWIFFARRTVRIVLPYYAALIISLMLIYLLIGQQDGSNWADTSLPVSFNSVITHIFLVHQWFPDVASKINPAFWSVGVEYQIYFLFPFFYWLAKKIGFAAAFIVIALVSYTLWGASYYLNTFNPSSTGTSIYYCALFFMGMTAAHLAKNIDSSTSRWQVMLDLNAKSVAIAALTSIFIVAIASFLIERFVPEIFFPLQIQSFFIGLFFSVLLYLTAKNKLWGTKYLKKFFFRHELEWVGVMGFSIYLLHYPILAIVWKYVVIPMHLPFYWLQTLAELLIGISATIIASMAFYRYIELPCHQLSKSIVKR